MLPTPVHAHNRRPHTRAAQQKPIAVTARTRTNNPRRSRDGAIAKESTPHTPAVRSLPHTRACARARQARRPRRRAGAKRRLPRAACSLLIGQCFQPAADGRCKGQPMLRHASCGSRCIPTRTYAYAHAHPGRRHASSKYEAAAAYSKDSSWRLNAHQHAPAAPAKHDACTACARTPH